LLLGGFGEDRGFDRDLAAQLARAQDLEAVLQLVNHAQVKQSLRIKAGAFEFVERRHIHDRVFLAEDILESAFRQTAMERHLAAFKTAHARITRDRLRTLGAAAGELAAAGTHTLAQAAMLLFLTLRRSELT